MNSKVVKNLAKKMLVIVSAIIITFLVGCMFENGQVMAKYVQNQKNTVTCLFREIKIEEEEISVDYDTWVDGYVSVTISTDENLVIEYQIDDGEWTEYTGAIQISSDSVINARLADGEIKYQVTSKEVLTPVASISYDGVTTYYTTLTDAEEDCKTTGEDKQREIDLLQDVTESITIESGKDIILDLNGYTITSEENTITSSAEQLTISGNGTVTSTTGVAVYNNGTGTLTIGEDDGIVGTDNPEIIGLTSGVESTSGTLNFYDGTIYGSTGTSINGTVAGKPEGYRIVNGTETIDGTNYETSYLSNIYTVTFDYLSNGGTSVTVANAQVEYGKEVDLTPTAIKTGWTFVGWNIDKDAGTGMSSYTMGASDITLYAQWIIDGYQISYVLNGGTLGTGVTNPTSYTVDSDTITLNNPSKLGYTFDGWTGSNGTTPELTVTIEKGSTGDRTYVANWTINTYTIEYDLGGGILETGVTNPTEYTVLSEDITLNNPSKARYVFDGWTGSNGTTPELTVTIETGSTGNKSYVANWTEANYSVSTTSGTYYYLTLAEAVTAADKAGSIITVLKDNEDASAASINKDLTINTNGKTIILTNKITVNTGYELTLEGNGTLERTTGTLISAQGATVNVDGPTLTSTDYVIDGTNSGHVNVTSGTITSTGKTNATDSRAIWATDVNVTGGTISAATSTTGYGIISNGTANISGGQITGKYGFLQSSGTGTIGGTAEITGTTYGIVSWPVHSGDVIISGGTVSSSGTYAIYNQGTGDITVEGGIITGTRGIHSEGTGNITVEGGTIEGTTSIGIRNGSGTLTVTGGNVTGATHGIYNSTTGTVTLGTNEETPEVSIEVPTIIGTESGVTIVTGTFNFYDGILKGTTSALAGTVADTPTGYSVKYGTETIGETAYNTAYLGNTYTVTYDYATNGGTSSTVTTATVTYNNEVDLTPTAIKTGYTFVGWNTDKDATQGLTSLTMGTEDITLYAIFSVNTYQISYTLNGGTLAIGATNPSTYTIETETITLNNPTKEGYTFTGWTGSNGATPETTVTITKGSTGNRTYVANWEINTYTLSYNLDGGQLASGVTNPETYTIETEDITLNNPTKEGYEFAGWALTKLDGVEQTGISAENPKVIAKGTVGNREYTAIWTTEGTSTSYKVEHYKETLNGTYELANTQNLVGETSATATAKSALENAELADEYEGFTLDLTNENTVATGEIASDGSLVLKLYYTRNEYTLTLVAGENIASVNGQGTYKYGQNVEISAELAEVEGHTITFNAWTSEGAGLVSVPETQTGTIEMPAGNVTITATADKTVNEYGYTIEYYYDEIIDADKTVTATAEFGSKIETYEDKVINGYKLDTVTNKPLTITTNESNNVMKVYYVKDSFGYTIEYYYDGTIDADKTVTGTAEFNSTIDTYEEKPVTGYELEGTENCPMTITSDASNNVMKVNYKLTTYNIAYTLNGGELEAGVINPTTYNLKTETITLNNPIKAGYLFDGWTGSNGTTPEMTVTIETGSTGDRTYVANWTAIVASTTIGTNTTYYRTVQEAINAAGTNEATVTLLYDGTRTEAVTVAEGQNITLNTNEKTLTSAESTVINNGTLTIEGNGIIKGTTTEAYGTIANTGKLTTGNVTVETRYAGIVNSGSGTVVVDGTIINSTRYGILNRIETVSEEPSIRIIDATITSSSNSLSAGSIGTVNVEGGTFTSTGETTPSVITSGATLNISGGTITGKAAAVYNNSATAVINITGGTIKSTTTNGVTSVLAGTINVTGGNITGTYGIYNSSTGKINVTGGNITGTTNSGIYNYSTGTVTVSGGNITGITGIYSESTGKTIIEGGTITGTTDYGVRVGPGEISVSGDTTEITGVTRGITVTTGTATITGGTLKATNGYGILLNGGILTVGIDEETPDVSTTTPTIIGTDAGIYVISGTFNFYDGILKGTTSALAGTVTDTPTGYSVKDGIETIDGTEYKTAYLGNTYTVTYNYSANGGTSATATTKTVTYNNAIDLTPTATKSGWTFVGWNTDKDATRGLESLTMDASDVTLYAIYSKTFTVKYYEYQNKEIIQEVTIYNTATSAEITLPEIASVTIDGVEYSARGWSTSPEGNAEVAFETGDTTTITADVTYYASYQATITATMYYSTLSSTSAAATTAPETVQVDGIRYLAYTGIFIQSKYEVPAVVTSSIGGLMAPTYLGLATGNTTDTIVTPTTEITEYYAIYKKDVYFYYYDGTSATSKTLTRLMGYNGTNYEALFDKGQEIPTASASYNGATFMYWGPPDMLAVPASYTSTYYRKTVTITYDTVGGSGVSGETKYIWSHATANGMVEDDKNIEITSAEPTKEGYTFVGWNSAADGTGTEYVAGESYEFEEDTTIYAQWEEANYSVSTTSGTYYYLTLAEAVSKADATDSVITVLKDNEDSSTVTIDKDLTLNTNGKTVTYANTITVNSGNELTLTGEGTLQRPTGGLITASGATVNVDGPTLTSTDYTINIPSKGTVNLTSGSIINTGKTNNTYAAAINGSYVNVTGGTIESTQFGILASGNVTVSGGNISGVHGVCQTAGTLTVTDTAEISGTTYGIVCYSAHSGNVVIKGGNISTSSTYAIMNQGKGYITVEGGTVQGIRNDSANTVTVAGGTVISSKGYGICNTGAGMVTVNEGTITGTTGIYNQSTGTVTVNGGTVTGTTSYGIRNNSTGKINVTGGTVISSKGIAIVNHTTGTVNVSGGTVSGTTGIYNDAAGIINVTGGKVEGTSESAVRVGSGNLTVSGETTEITGQTYGITVITGTATVEGGNITGTINSGIYNYSSGTVTVNGGNVIGATERGIHNYAEGTVKITGGNITGTQGIYNTSTGAIIVEGGTITATNGTGIVGNDGILTIGVNEESPEVSTSMPTIVGTYNGISIEEGTINFYDGIIKGQNSAISGTVSDTPTGYSVENGTETIDGTEYKTAYLSNIYTVTYDANRQTNYLRTSSDTIVLDGFTSPGQENLQFQIGTFYTSGLSEGDEITCTFDVEYENVQLGTGSTTRILYPQGSGNNTVWSPGISFAVNNGTIGTGTMTYTESRTITAEQLQNTYFILTFRTDNIISGTIKVTNFRITKSNETTSEEKVYGEELGTLATLTETGYTFDGWYTAAEGGEQVTSATTMPAKDVTYYAQWTANTYNVKYNGNGATSGSMENSTYAYDETANLTSNAYERKYTVTYNHNYEGSTDTTKTSTYTFKNWNKLADGTGTSYADGARIWKLTTTNGETINLYAQWTQTSVTYIPTRTYYAFGGWYSDAECTTQVVSSEGVYTPTADITLYAKWIPDGYQISYTLNGGSLAEGVTNPTSYTIETEDITLNNPTKEGYLFDGWTGSNGTTPELTVTIETGSTGNRSYVANWSKVVATVEDSAGVVTEYRTLQEAVTAAKSLSGSTVRLLQDVTEDITIADGTAGFTIDLGGYELTGTGNSAQTFSISTRYAVTVTNGTITANVGDVVKSSVSAGNIYFVLSDIDLNSNDGYAVTASGFGAKIENCTIESTSTTTDYAVNAGSSYFHITNATINSVTGGIIKSVGGPFSLGNSTVNSKTIGYNNENSGTDAISKSTIISDEDVAIKISGASPMVINAGSIIKSNQSNAIETSGISTYPISIDSNSSEFSIETPCIQGAEYGIYFEDGAKLTTYYHNNGIIKGQTAATNGSSSTKREGYSVVNGTETIDGATYETAYLSNIYTVTYSSNLVGNGDLAEDADGWTLNSYGHFDTNVQYEGQNSIRITSSTASYTGITSSYNITYKPNTTYRISLKAYRDSESEYGDLNASRYLRVYLSEYNSSGTIVDYHHKLNITNSNLPDKTWQSYSTTFTTADLVGGYFGKLSLNFHNVSGTTNVWVTDIKVEEIHTEEKEYNTELGTLPEVTRTGYTLNGWYTAEEDGDQISSTTTMPANDVTYYAHWTPNTYTVVYNGNGATSGSMENTTHTYNDSKTLTTNAYARTYTVTYNHNYEGSTNTTKTATYTFKNWNTNLAGTGTSYSNGAKVINLESTAGGTVNLYAQWTSASITYLPTRDGYTFAGWYTNEECTGTPVNTDGVYTPTSNITVYAKWIAEGYQIAYTLNGGSLPDGVANPIVYSADSETFTLNNPVKADYVFDGWTGSNGTTPEMTVTIETGSTGDRTYVANWTEANYSVSTTSGTYYYLTLAEAVSKADATDSVITVLKDNEDSSTVTIDKDLTLDTNGKTVTYTNTITVNSGKTLTLTGEGTLQRTTGGLITASGATVNVDGPTLTSTDYTVYAPSNGTVNVTSGTITSTGTTEKSDSRGIGGSNINVTGGIIEAVTYGIISNGTATISGGTVSGKYGICASSGTLTVTGSGEVTGTTYGIVAWPAHSGDVIISGGTVSSSGTYAIYNQGTGDVTVEGGTVYGISNYAANIVTVTGGTVTSSTGYAIHNHVAGTVNVSGGTVSGTQGIYNDAAGIINVTGGKVEGTSGSAIRTCTGTLTISGDATEVIGQTYGVSVTTGTVTVDSGTVTGKTNYGIYNYGVGTVNVNGGTITSNTSYGIYNYSTGTVTVTGGNITGKSGIYSESTGKTIIEGGTITGTTNYGVRVGPGEISVSGDSTEITGVTRGITVTTGTATITGGTLKATNGYGILLNGGTLTLGTDEETPEVSTTVPTVQGTEGGVTIVSGTFNFYDGILKGVTTALSGTVTDTPTGYSVKDGTETIDEVEYKTAYLVRTYQISYTLNEGSLPDGVTNPTSYNVEDETITLNNPIRENYVFTGWTGSNGTTPETTVTIEAGSTGDKSYVANWADAVASTTISEETTYYLTVQEAIDAAGTDTATVTLVYDDTRTEAITVAEGQNITLDTNGKTLTSEANTVLNYGTLTLNGTGTIDGTGTNYATIASYGTVVSNVNITGQQGAAIWNTGTYTIAGGTVEYFVEGTTEAVIWNYGTMKITGGTVQESVSGYWAIANYSAFEISGGTITSNTNAVYCFESDSTLNITGGTIIGADIGVNINDGYGEISGDVIITGTNRGISVDKGYLLVTEGTIVSTEGAGIYKGGKNGIVQIGDNSDEVSTTVPEITGATYGVYINKETTTFNFYDGILRGAVGQSLYGDTDNTPEGYSVKHGTETIDGTTYETAYLGNVHTITYKSNIIANSDLSEGTERWNMSSYGFLDTDVQYEGQNSIRIYTTGSTYNGIRTLYQPTFKANTTYRISLKAYRNSASEYGDVTKALRVYIPEYNSSGTVTQWNHNINITASNLPDKTWKEFTTTITTSSSSVRFGYLQLDFNAVAGTSNVWVSDIKVEEIYTEDLEYNTELGELPEVTRTGYTLDGWYTAEEGGTQISSTTTVPGENTTYYAQWTPNTYYVQYNGNGANGGSMSNSTHTYDKSQALTANGYEKLSTITYDHNYSGSTNTTKTATCTFRNWNKAADGSSTSYADSASVVSLTSTAGETVNLYAQWGSASVLYIPTRQGYEFVGWCLDADCTNQVTDENGTYEATENITLYAKWNPYSYTIEYNGNGATSGTMSNSTHTYDVAQNLNKNTYEREYTVTFNHNYDGSTNTTQIATYEFNGWNIYDDGTGTSYVDEESVINLDYIPITITLYAQWNSTSVTYQPTRENYVFNGWFLDAECTESVTGAIGTYTPTSDITLYAKWTQILFVEITGVPSGSETATNAAGEVILNNKYGSVTEAVADAGLVYSSTEPVTMRLLGDIEDEIITIPESHNVTLDLESYKISANSTDYVITNNGTLTLEGASGIVTNSGNGAITNTGTLTITEPTIETTAADAIAVNNTKTFTFNTGEINATASGGIAINNSASVINNGGTITASIGINQTAGTTQFKGGVINATNYGIKSTYGRVVTSAGMITGTNYGIEATAGMVVLSNTYVSGNVGVYMYETEGKTLVFSMTSGYINGTGSYGISLHANSMTTTISGGTVNCANGIGLLYNSASIAHISGGEFVGAQGIVVASGASLDLYDENNVISEGPVVRGTSVGLVIQDTAEVTFIAGAIKGVNAPFQGSIQPTDGISYKTTQETIDGATYYVVTPVKQISFTIDGITYYAESGMTWGEWVESDYNTDGYYAGGESSPYIVKKSSSYPLYNSAGTMVYDTDTVIENEEYYFQYTTGLPPD